jgi:hypothetical protein
LNINFGGAQAGGPSVSGEVGQGGVEELMKALTAGYGTDVATLTGGAALRIQSLDKTLMSTIQENDHFVLFNLLSKGDATATVDEWTEQSSVGGYLGGSTNSELGVIAGFQGAYARRVGQVKYLMTRREVSFVQTLQNAISDSEATEQNNGALQLLTDAEYLCFEGDSTVVPTEFDGIGAQIASYNGGDHVVDMHGGTLSSIIPINVGVAKVSGYGNFGKATNLILSNLTQADFDNGLDPAFRVSLEGTGKDVQLGAPVSGIRTSKGTIKLSSDVFVRDHDLKIPFENAYPTVAAANASIAPASVAAGAPGADTAARFDVGMAGSFYYYVTGINQNGQSTGVKSGQVTIATGNSVALTITRSAGAQETGYVIYRSRVGGGNVTLRTDQYLSDFREMCRIPVAGATTVYTDRNLDIPGTSRAYLLNMTQGAKAITWRKLLPMMRFNLYPTVSATIPWAQLMFGYLRIAKRAHHIVYKNIVPGGAVWKPFTLV